MAIKKNISNFQTLLKRISMTSEEKTNYTRIGLGLSGVVVNTPTAEIIWRTIEGLQEKKGKFSISDSVEIERLVKGKLEKKKKISLEENSKKSEKISERKEQRKEHQAKKFGNGNYKYNFSYAGKSPSLHFKNKLGKECIITRLSENNGKAVVLYVGGRPIPLSVGQKAKFGKLIEKDGFNRNDVYDLAYEISNNFTAYIDASGRTIKVSR